MAFDVVGDGQQIPGRVHHHTDRNFDAVDVGEQR